MRYYILRRFFKYFAPFLSIIDKGLIKKYCSQKIKHQPVFIIGAPRTGSTILYQLITNFLNVSYINNFTYLGYKSLFLNFKISENKFLNKPHNSFKSNYGTTDKDNLNAPSEGGLFWLRWLPKDKDYISYNEGLKIESSALKDYIIAITNYFNRPLVFKNLNAGMRIAFLTQLFPESKFIFIKRDPLYTIQSILRARIKNKIKPNQWWSIKPPNFKDYCSNGEIQLVSSQVLEIEHQIQQDLNKYVESNNFMVVNYETVNNVDSIIAEVQKFIGDVSFKTPVPSDLIVHPKNVKTLSDDDFEKIKEIIDRY